VRIQSLTLEVANPAACAAFYRDALGLPAAVNATDPTSPSVQIGWSRLVFRQRQPSVAGVYHLALNIPEDKIEAGLAWLSARCAAPCDPISVEGESIFYYENWDAHAVYFRDPAGNLVELIARHTLPQRMPPQTMPLPTTSTPFSAADLLCISEIGIVSAAVEQTVARLTSTYNLPLYGSGSSTFQPVGDVEGLLIVVAAGRAWFPDQVDHAVALPLQVTFATVSGGDLQTLTFHPDRDQIES